MLNTVKSIKQVCAVLRIELAKKELVQQKGKLMQLFTQYSILVHVSARAKSLSSLISLNLLLNSFNMKLIPFSITNLKFAVEILLLVYPLNILSFGRCPEFPERSCKSFENGSIRIHPNYSDLKTVRITDKST
jgi:hypothetical protein